MKKSCGQWDIMKLVQALKSTLQLRKKKLSRKIQTYIVFLTPRKKNISYIKMTKPLQCIHLKNKVKDRPLMVEQRLSSIVK